jgi:hypothetical protein
VRVKNGVFVVANDGILGVFWTDMGDCAIMRSRKRVASVL